MRIMQDEGWIVIRSAGSYGEFDILCVRDGIVKLVEVKSTRRPYDGFRPADRAALSRVAAQAGFPAVLAWKQPYKGFTEIPSEEWPGGD